MSSRALTVGNIEKIHRLLKEHEGQDEFLITLIHTTVTIALACLLKVDEVLNIQFDDAVRDEKKSYCHLEEPGNSTVRG